MARTNLRRTAAAVAAMSLGLAACSPSPADQSRQACTWTIGIMGALEGEFAEFGAAPARGVGIAVDLANESGDLACTLETHSEDTGAEPKKAPASARRLVEDEDLVACVCGYFSRETAATGDVFGDGGVAMLSTSEQSAMRELGFETWFRLVTPVDRQAIATGTYIRRVYDPRSVAIVLPAARFAYSVDVADHLRAALRGRFEGPLVELNPEESGVDDAARQIRRMSPDVVFYAGYAPEPWEVFRALRTTYGLKMPFLTDGGAISGPQGRTAAGRIVLSCACSDVTKFDGAEAFVAAYRERYGTAPQLFAAEGFDGANAVIDALRQLSGSEPTEEARAHVVDYLDGTDGVDGLVKRYAWDDGGELMTDDGDVWMWEWTSRRGFRMLGSVAELVR
ncbi:MAG TPA: branched-chain amino acid ABC transporter substrate-binding protein [Actinomycetota bacterium]|nr:branched-chain amino acid ABC transporter substrate-binding protein [Actinomycetota bacterium]